MANEGTPRWVPFARGTEEDRDYREDNPPILKVAKNVVYDTGARLRMRRGYGKDVATDTAAATVTDKALNVWEGQHGERSIVGRPYQGLQNNPTPVGRVWTALASDRLQALPAGATGGTEIPLVGEMLRHTISGTDAVTTPFQLGSATRDGRTVTVRGLSVSSFQIIVTDAISGAVVYSTTKTGCAQPRVWAWDDVSAIGIGWIVVATGAVQWIRIDSGFNNVANILGGTPYTAPGPVAVAYNGYEDWDVIPVDITSGGAIAIATAAATSASLYVVSSTNVTLSGPHTLCVGAYLPESICLASISGYLGAAMRVEVSTGPSMYEIQAWTGSVAGTGVVSAENRGTVVAAASALADPVAGWYLDADFPTAPVMLVLHYITSTLVGGYIADTVVVAVPPSVTGITSYTVPGARYASKVFSDGETPLCVMGASHAATGGLGVHSYLYVLKNASYYCIARLQHETAALSSYDYDRPIPAYIDNTARIALFDAFEGNIVVVPGGVRPMMPVLFEVDLKGRARGRAIVHDNASLLTGGGVLHVDGERVSESGFWDGACYSIGYTGSSTTAWSFRVTFEEVDADGRIHRSPVGYALTYTNINAGAAVSVIVNSPVRTLRRSGTVRACIWRTVDGGSIYYLNHSLPCSSPGAQVTYSGLQTIADAVLQTREVLYTDTGLPEEWTPFPTQAIASHGNRAWCAQGSRLYYTAESNSSHAPRWSATSWLDVPGEVTALASTGDRLIVLTERACYSLSGTGPDAIGNGQWGALEQVATVGCPRAKGGQRACARTSLGVVWRSDAGLHITDGTTAQVISDRVRDTLTAYLTTVAIVDDQVRRRLRVTLNESDTTDANGAGLVWQYDLPDQPWTTETYAMTGIGGACLIDGYHTVATRHPSDTGVTWSQTGNPFVDTWKNGDSGEFTTKAIPVEIRTYPIFPAGLGVSARVRRVMVEGEATAQGQVISLVPYLDGVNTSAHDRSIVAPGSGRMSIHVELAAQRFETIEALFQGGGQEMAEFSGFTLYTEDDGTPRAGSDRRV